MRDEGWSPAGLPELARGPHRRGDVPVRDPTRGDGRDARLRLGVVGRAPLRRLLDVSRRHAGALVPRRADELDHARDRRGDPAVERPVAGRREDHAARSPGRGPAGVRDGPGPGEDGVHRLPAGHERGPRALRRGRADDHHRARDRRHGERRAVLPAAPRRAAAAALALVQGPHLLGGDVAGLRRRRRRARRRHDDVPADGDRAITCRRSTATASCSVPPTARNRSRRRSRSSSTATATPSRPRRPPAGTCRSTSCRSSSTTSSPARTSVRRRGTRPTTRAPA